MSSYLAQFSTTLFSTAMLCLAIFATPPAAAGQGARVPASQSIVDQKRLLVENMAFRSVAAKTITDSGDSEAIAALSKAKGLIENAKKASADGKYQDADDKLNEALKLINDHARRLTLSSVGADRAKVLFERRRHAVETFVKAYERVASDPNADASQQPKEHTAWIAGKLAEADALAAKGEHEKARELLEAAYERTRGLIRSMRAGQTLTRSLNFATAEEAYQYELKLNESHFALLEFAIVEKSPRGSLVERVHQTRDEARKMRGVAEAKAKEGDYPGAIVELTSSTKILLQAIRLSGIFVPG
jgi:tetratricopeptide (TPR) repeat protein